MQRLPVPVEVKICGLTTPQAVQEAARAAGAAYLGFVFFPPSPRSLTPDRALALKAHIPPDSGARTVAVLVDPDDALLDAVTHTLAPDFLQLHGAESPERVRDITSRHPEIRIIKALPVSSGDDIAAAGRYADTAHMLLFDAKPPRHAPLPGGNGLAFDWALLSGRCLPLPWFLSGGLSTENVGDAVRLSGAARVDASSSLEIRAGEKDPRLIRAFLTAVQSITA